MNRLCALILFLLSANFAHGQASSAVPVAVNNNGTPTRTLVTVCTTDPKNGTCPTLVTTYTDFTLGTACTGTGTLLHNPVGNTAATGCSNPGYTDANGFTLAYSGAGSWWCQFSGSTTSPYSVPCPSTGAGSSGGTPGGTATQIQYNNSGAFGGVSGSSVSAGQIGMGQTAAGLGGAFWAGANPGIAGFGSHGQANGMDLFGGRWNFYDQSFNAVGLISQSSTEFGVQSLIPNSTFYIQGDVSTLNTHAGVAFSSGNFSAASGTQIAVTASGDSTAPDIFDPSGGSANFIDFLAQPQIDQLSGATGTITVLGAYPYNNSLLGTEYLLGLGTASAQGNTATLTNKFTVDNSGNTGISGLTTLTGGGVVPSGATLTIQSGATLTCAAGSTCPTATTRTWLFAYQGVCQAGVASAPVNFPTTNAPSYVACTSTTITPEWQIPSTNTSDTFWVKLRVPPGHTGAYTLTTTYRSAATTNTATVQPTYACVAGGAVPDNPSFSNAGSTFTLTPAGTTLQNVTTTDTFTPTCADGADLYVMYTFTANTVASPINFSYVSLAVQGSL